jgi:hypothetical protein
MSSISSLYTLLAPTLILILTHISMLLQSFFGVLTPQLCEKLIGGQETQIMLHTHVPSAFFGRKYVDLFRALNSRRVSDAHAIPFDI